MARAHTMRMSRAGTLPAPTKQTPPPSTEIAPAPRPPRRGRKALATVGAVIVGGAGTAPLWVPEVGEFIRGGQGTAQGPGAGPENGNRTILLQPGDICNKLGAPGTKLSNEVLRVIGDANCTPHQNPELGIIDSGTWETKGGLSVAVHVTPRFVGGHDGATNRLESFQDVPVKGAETAFYIPHNGIVVAFTEGYAVTVTGLMPGSEGLHYELPGAGTSLPPIAEEFITAMTSQSR